LRSLQLVCYDPIMRSFRFYPAVILAVILSALAGGFFGSNLLAGQDDLQQQYRIFTSALSAIDREYVETVPSERLVYGAIEGMLKTLDPHSSFFDPRQYTQLRERQEGRYYGLGIQIQVIDGDITVMSIFEGSPAYKRGLRRGDIIARIGDEDAKGWTSEKAVSKLKGPKGTSVHISLRRRGYEGLIDLEIERDEVNITTVRGAFMVDSQTGYIKLGDFSETSDDEVGRALKDLSAKGMKRLVFDLRDNPGGPLEQAIRVSNRFLDRGELVVYTDGRVSNARQKYWAEQESEYADVPLVLLVNRNSASASEIVAGAIQDHDRGLVVGETTFGKALVQSVYRIAGNAGLALTTGRYYTPSGRMIQRPWDGSFDEYLTYSLRDQTADRKHSALEEKHTDAGRKVYSGGGIEPDMFIVGPVEGFNPTRYGRMLYARQAFANFADQFTAEGDTRLSAANQGKKRIALGFKVTDAIVADFKSSLRSQKATVDEEAFAKDDAFIRAMIHYDIDLALFGVSEARRNLFAVEPQAQFALQQFPEAVRLTEMTKARASRGAKAR
jgi:carboxyl-terminal processing protease